MEKKKQSKFVQQLMNMYDIAQAMLVDLVDEYTALDKNTTRKDKQQALESMKEIISYLGEK